MESLAENFNQYFRVHLAVTRVQQRYAYAIRYQVYAEELGWEPLDASQLETDLCDDYALHCLLEHKRSGDIAGCVRLVMPPSGCYDAKLPCQLHEVSFDEALERRFRPPGQVGEISRLAVTKGFRRRDRESGKPFILDDHNTSGMYTEEERRNVPNLSLGLYLSAIATVDLCELKRVMVVMEPRLQRHLKRFGLAFHQISDVFELRGKRALFELPRHELTCNMELPILGLYRNIRRDLASQWQESQLKSVL
jgi:N-acyl amino acid synthase of PEP-CTERM/exosortase system